METFELWAHRGRGDLYAVRRTDGRLTGACGPLPPEIMAIVDLSACRYEGPESLQARQHEFVPAERWALGFENRAVILGALARARRSSGGAAAAQPAAISRPALVPGAPALSEASGPSSRALVRKTPPP